MISALWQVLSLGWLSLLLCEMNIQHKVNQALKGMWFLLGNVKDVSEMTISLIMDRLLVLGNSF